MSWTDLWIVMLCFIGANVIFVLGWIVGANLTTERQQRRDHRRIAAVVEHLKHQWFVPYPVDELWGERAVRLSTKGDSQALIYQPLLVRLGYTHTRTRIEVIVARQDLVEPLLQILQELPDDEVVVLIEPAI